MQGFQKVLFLAIICFFGSASVFVAGTDMLRRLGKHTAEEEARAKEFIHHLRGEVLSKDSQGLVHSGRIPARSGGSILSDNDKNRIKRLFGGLASSDAKQDNSNTEASADEDRHVPTESLAEDKAG